MFHAVIERRLLALPLVAAAAVSVGALTATEPRLPLGLAAVTVIGFAAFTAPVASVVALVFLTAVLPYGLQNRFGVGGGTGSAGLLLSDLLLLAALGRAAVSLSRQPIDRRRAVLAALVVLFLLIAGLQFARVLHNGQTPSAAGAEFRVLLGFGMFLVVFPLLSEQAARQRLLRGLLALGFVLGVWGLVQWVAGFEFSEASDAGIREGVRLTSGGSGQLQGGLYGFPVAILVAYAVLLSGAVRSLAARVTVLAVVVLNAVSVVLTFERTFWLATAVGVAFITLKAGRAKRAKAVLATPILLAVSLALFSVVAPGQLATARERLLSLGQYSSDDSLRSRLEESRHVLAEIRERPAVGSGLAATITWGQPWALVSSRTTSFAHNGYLWLAWKVGIPGAALLVILLGSAIAWRAPPVGGALWHGLRNGAQGALLVLLLITVNFPSFSALSITPVIGLLFALATLPPEEPAFVRDRVGG